LCDIYVAVLDERRELSIEERQQQSTNMRSVDVGVGHDDDSVVAQFPDVEVLRADSTSERRDHGLDFIAAQHLVESSFLDVENLAPQRQDGLKASIAALLGGTTG